MREISNSQATVRAVTFDSFDPEAMTETVQQSRLDHTLLQGADSGAVFCRRGRGAVDSTAANTTCPSWPGDRWRRTV